MTEKFSENSERTTLSTAGVLSGEPNLTVGGHYKIVRQLADGGFGQTFVAQDLHLPGQPLCVVKQLKTQFSHPAAFKTARRLFDQEARVLYALGEHTQIPRLLAHFEEAQRFYLVQELVEGGPLSERLAPAQRWSEEEAIALLQDLLRVLSFVHTNGVIHRDIKPANLLWRESDARVVLIDFGAVKAVQQASTIAAKRQDAELQTSAQSAPSTIAIGTPGYMPIEQQSGKPRFSSDIYAVGMVAIQALTGLPPTQIARNRETEEIEWRSHAPTISLDLADLIDTMVRYDFRSRFTDASAALKALDALSEKTLSEKTLLEKTLFTVDSTHPSTQTAQPQRTQVQRTQVQRAPHANQSSIKKPARTIHYGLLIGPVVLSAAVLSWQVGRLDLNSIVTEIVSDASADLPAESHVETAISVDSISSNTNSSSDIASVSAPQAAIDLVKKADEHFAQRDYAQAITLYNQATRLGLDTTETQWNHCNQLAEQGQSNAALEVCALVAGAGSSDMRDVIIAGAHLAQSGEYARSLTVLTQVEYIEPNSLSLFWPKAITLNGLNRYEEALATAESGLAQLQNLDIPDIEALLLVEKGNALIGLDQPEQALSLATKALVRSPQLPMALDLTEKAQLAMQ